MKKITAILLAVFFVFWQISLTAQAADPLKVYFFYGKGCPHCSKEAKFLEELEEKYSDIKIETFEIYLNRKNASLLQKISETFEKEISGVPVSIIGDEFFIGFSEGLTSEKIEKKVLECRKSSCSDRVANIINSTEREYQEAKQSGDGEKMDEIINLPWLGEVSVQTFSLPVLTVVMGFLDGFNPCAMWALLFLISLLLGLKSRKRRWILGVVFIVTSAFVYFLFMSAWLNFILLLGLIFWVRIVIGLLALAGGGYSLKKFILEKNSGCKVAGDENRQKIFQKLKALVGRNSLWIALGGIIALAFMVNLVELICSAGLPAVYTQVLALNQLPVWQYYLYMLLYILFFMIDDLFVFFIAMATLEITGISTKYSRWSQLIGGIIMLLIGLLLIFKPDWLMFG